MNLGRLIVRVQTDPAGVLEATPRPDPVILIHIGAPVEIGCERGGQMHCGLSVHGDVDVIPPGTASRWTLKKEDCGLIVRIPQELLVDAAASLNLDPDEARLVNRFQMRDPQIEHLGWALKAELERSHKSGQLFADSIGTALACRLLQTHSLAATKTAQPQPGAMSPYRLRRVLAFIEENLSSDLSLASIATVSGLSISHCQRAFRIAVGVSVHQYVIQRRVERAKSLLLDKKLPVGEVALAVGFSHQSHLAYHMRRLLGATPLDFREDS
jgi:AraC family transcriptional regulator